MIRFNLSMAWMLALAGLLLPHAVRAAQSYGNCAGFITAVPVSISTQGTWCLKQNISTSGTSSSAIVVSTNNVTIDCNGFKLDDSGAGLGTFMTGVFSIDHVNTTVRHCDIRGFLHGVQLTGTTSGNVVEDSRFDGNTNAGILVNGDGSVVRRNLVFNTGGSTNSATATGIGTADSVDVIDNTISGATATSGGNNAAYGMYLSNNLRGRITGNRVSGVVATGLASSSGIYETASGYAILRDNILVGDASTGSKGLQCVDGHAIAKGNVIGAFATGIANCTDGGGNDVTP